MEKISREEAIAALITDCENVGRIEAIEMLHGVAVGDIDPEMMPRYAEILPDDAKCKLLYIVKTMTARGNV
jgi:hypothetical protein